MSFVSLGWITGIIVGIILVIILIKVINKDGALRTKYDERQQIARGKANMYGFYTCLIACAVMLFLNTGNFGAEKLGYAGFFIPIMAGLVGQVSYSIFKDAYVGLNTNMTRFIIIMAAIGAFNLFFGIMAAVNGELIVDGQFKGPIINLLCGILFVIIFAELVIKKAIDAREG